MAAESLGSAYVDVHARTAGFDGEVARAATKAANKAEKALNRAMTRGTTAGAKASQKALENVGKTATQIAARVAARQAIVDKAHAKAIRHMAKLESDAHKENLRRIGQVGSRQAAVDKAHAAAIRHMARLEEKAYAENARRATAAAKRQRQIDQAQIRAINEQVVASSKRFGAGELRSFTGGLGRELRGLGEEFSNLRRAGDRTFRVMDDAGKRFATQFKRELKGIAPVGKAELDRLDREVQRAMRNAASKFGSSATSISNAGAAAARSVIDDFARVDNALGRALRGGRVAGAFKPILTQSDLVARSIEQRFERAGRNIANSLSTALKVGLGGVAAAGVAGGGAATFFGLKAASDIQQAQFQFQNMAVVLDEFRTNLVGAKQVGDDFVDSLLAISNESSLTFQTLRDTSTALLALGIDGEGAKSVVLDFANAAAAAGKSGTELNESVAGAVRALTQLTSKGKVSFQDLNQIAERIPSIQRVKIFDQLKEQLDIDAAELDKRLEEGTIDARQGVQAILQVARDAQGAVDEAGVTALEKQSKTLAGRLEAIRDNLRTSLGKAFLPIADDIAKQLDSQEFRKTFAGALEGLAAPLTGKDGPIGRLVPALTEALPGIAANVGKIFAAVTAGFVAALPFIEKVFSFVSKVFDSAQSGQINQFFGAIASVIKPLTPVFETLFNVVKAVFPIIVGVVKSFAPLVAIVVTLLKPVLGLVNLFAKFLELPLIKNIAILVTSFFALGGFFKTFGTIVSGVINGFRGLTTSLNNLGIVGRILALVLRVAIAPFRFLFSIIRAGLPNLSRFLFLISPLGLAFNVLRGAIRPILLVLSQLAAAVQNLVGIIPGMSTAIDKVAGAAKKAWGWAKKLGGGIKDLVTNTKKAYPPTEKLATIIGRATAASVLFSNSATMMAARAGELGEKAQEAAQRLDDLNAKINALPANTDVTVRFRLIGEANELALRAMGIVPTGLEDATGFSTEFLTSDAFNNSLKKAIGSGPSAKDVASQLPKGSSKTDDAAKEAADKAKEAAERFKESLREILKDLDREFRRGLINGDAENARQTLADLSKRISEAFLEAGKKPPSRLLKQLAEDSARLQKLINQREKIVARLEKAAEARDSTIADTLGFGNLNGITQQLQALNDELTQTTTVVADLTRLRIIRSGESNIVAAALGGDDAIKKSEVTAKNIQRILDERLQAVRNFRRNIESLIQKGLNRTLIQQLIEGGVEGSGQTAAALARASQGTLAAINQTQEQLDEQAKKLGSIAGDVAAGIGENVVIGLVNGLKTQKKELVDAITDLVDEIIRRVRKGLDVKSPSRVMMRIGRYAAQGLAQGMLKGSAGVASAAATLAKSAQPSRASMNFGGSIQANAIRGARAQAAAIGGGTTIDRSKSTTVHAPVTQNFYPAGNVDPNAVYQAFSQSVARGVR